MINRMSHRKRILLECLPYGVNVLFIGVVFFIIGILNPTYIDLRKKTIDFFSLKSFIYILRACAACSPMFFSLFIYTKESYLDRKMKLYDKQNGTKTYEAYYDESYEKNNLTSSSSALILSSLLASIELLIYILIKSIPITMPCIFGLITFPGGIYMIMYSLFFYVTEDDMLSSDADAKLETVIA